MFVNGVRYTNTAAKFWPNLIDEARQRASDCDRIELRTCTDEPFSPEMLYPGRSLQKGLDRLLEIDLATAMQETLAELEILGPPPFVEVRLLSGNTERLVWRTMPDSVNGEIFPFLVVWLFQWSGLHHTTWNNEFVHGEMVAEDRTREVLYKLDFALHSVHLSEGLYRRTLSLDFLTQLPA